MIDLAGLPVPKDAPESGCVRIERPEPGLARLVLDPPHRPKLAVLDAAVLRDLDRALDELERESALRGLVITGRAPLSFAGGADVDAIAEVTDPKLAAKFVRAGQDLFQRVHRFGREGGGRVRTVAAVGGPVPGGACELALACDRIVLAEDPKTRIGLPEVRLGILPAWGGTQRLPRRVGVLAALDVILAGKLVPARKAWKMGLVDRLTKPEYLLRIADGIAMGREQAPRKHRHGLAAWVVDKNPLASMVIRAQARKRVLAETRGHYPAPLAALTLVVKAPRTRLEVGLRAELEAVTPLSVSPITKHLVGLFQRSEEAKKLGESPDGSRVAGFARAAVVGGGVMGAGIASLLAQKGKAVRLRDIDRRALDRAEHAHRAELTKLLSRRILERSEHDAALDRFETTTEPLGFSRCDFAIEAVAERLEVKRAVMAELAGLCARGAVLATNTSSLSVDAIAEAIRDPERFVGLHFFNPVAKMPLVEIVRGSRTSDETVRRVARLSVELGKTPVVVKDVAGFLVNRLLGPYLDEALRLVAHGAHPDRIDEMMIRFGMPMGPCELVDEVGLDIAAHAGASLARAYGSRMQATSFLAPMLEAGELGKKTGKGLFEWGKAAKGRAGKIARNQRAFPAGAAVFTLSDEEALDRLVLAFVNEAARALEEGVVAGPRELDLACVFGTGFAPYRGGPLAYADARGLANVVERLRALEASSAIDGGRERRGRFEPAPLLMDLARSGGRFHA